VYPKDPHLSIIGCWALLSKVSDSHRTPDAEEQSGVETGPTRPSRITYDLVITNVLVFLQVPAADQLGPRGGADGAGRPGLPLAEGRREAPAAVPQLRRSPAHAGGLRLRFVSFGLI